MAGAHAHAVAGVVQLAAVDAAAAGQGVAVEGVVLEDEAPPPDVARVPAVHPVARDQAVFAMDPERPHGGGELAVDDLDVGAAEVDGAWRRPRRCAAGREAFGDQVTPDRLETVEPHMQAAQGDVPGIGLVRLVRDDAVGMVVGEDGQVLDPEGVAALETRASGGVSQSRQ